MSEGVAVVVHLGRPAFTVKVVVPESKPVHSIGKAFAKAFRKKFGGLKLERWSLVASGEVLSETAVVGDLGDGRAVTVVPVRAVASSCEVIAFMASHVNSSGRLRSFEACLASIAAQSVLPSRLVVGISASAEMRDGAQRALDAAADGLECRGVRCRVVFSEAAAAQFRHYASAVAEVSECADEAWCVFSDDDDLWHEDRVKTYDAAFAGARPSTHVLVAPVYALNREPLGPRVLPDSKIDVVRSSNGQPTNYYDVAVRLGLWREYFETTRRNEHLSVFADNHYLSWVYARQVSMPLVHVPPHCWMYLWRQDHGDTPQHVAALHGAHAPVVRRALERALDDQALQTRYRAVVPGAKHVPPEAVLNTFLADIVRAERKVELSRTWFFHGRYSIHQVDAYLDASEKGPDGGMTDDVKALLFPHQHADALKTKRDVERLRKARPDLDLDDDDRKTRAFLRDYVKRRLLTVAKRRYAYRPLDEDEVALAFTEAMMAGFS